VIRKMLIGFLVLIVALVVVADRVGAHVAAHVLAGKLQSDEHLASRPDTSIGGFPFLTQAVHGKYSDVKVTAHDVTTTDGVHIETLTVHLHGVHVPLSKVVGGSVKTVPVDHADGTAFVSFSEISQYLAGRGMTLTLNRASSGAVSVIGRIPLAGHVHRVDAAASIAVSHDVVTLSSSKLTGKVLRPFVLSIPLRSLPFRIDVTSVTVGVDGITGTGTANSVVLGS
jgi:hypothetical protein